MLAPTQGVINKLRALPAHDAALNGAFVSALTQTYLAGALFFVCARARVCASACAGVTVRVCVCA